MTASREQYVFDADGRRSAMILPAKRYEQLLEDLHDHVVVAERRNESAISIEALRVRLKQNGTVHYVRHQSAVYRDH
jgi:hypothetical protein